MLGKLLITVAVILAAFLYVRQRNLNEKATRGDGRPRTAAPETATAAAEFNSDLRLAAYLTVILMVGLGATLYYFRWQDDHTVVTVTLHRESQAQPISYQVYKYQLQDRSFVTVDGTSVTVASSERMEVLGLDD